MKEQYLLRHFLTYKAIDVSADCHGVLEDLLEKHPEALNKLPKGMKSRIKEARRNMERILEEDHQKREFLLKNR